MWQSLFWSTVLAFVVIGTAAAGSTAAGDDSAIPSQLRWVASQPLIGPSDRDGDHFYADKDPTFVQNPTDKSPGGWESSIRLNPGDESILR